MSWFRRGNAGPYYERARRVDGKVVKEYIGRGPHAELIALMDAQQRAEREATVRNARRERKRLKASVEPVIELTKTVELLVKSNLLVAGFHQHDRGEWRRRNVNA